MFKTNLDYALDQAKRGRTVFPVHYVLKDGNCSCGNTGCQNKGKHPMTPKGFKDATIDEQQIRAWWSQYPEANIGMATGQVSGLIVLDIDPRHGGDESLKYLISEHDPLPITYKVKTGGGGEHYYFKRPDKGLKCKNGMLPGVDIKADGGYIVGAGSNHASGKSYVVEVDAEIAEAPEWLIKRIEISKTNVSAETVTEASGNSTLSIVSDGVRTNTLVSLAGCLRARGVSQEAAIEASITDNSLRFRPPFTDAEVKKIVLDIYSRYQPHNICVYSDYKKEWKTKLSDKAYYGIAGEVVRRIDPYTEADPVAVLLQFLIMMGNVVGRNYCYQIGADTHYQNLNIIIVGDTAKARKGTSYSCAEMIFEFIDPTWVANCITTGLSSGEGLIDAVRDSRYKIDYKTKEQVIECEGVNDKRLLVFESEFANVFKVIAREGNTLSPVVRAAWDGRTLNVMTKNSKNKATGACISIVGHITKTEFIRNLNATEMANGFINRFLLVYATRSKYLPNGADIYEIKPDLEKIGAEIKNKVNLSTIVLRGMIEPKRLMFDSEAQKHWDSIYNDLSDPTPGITDGLISRKEPTVIRIASIYAILDGSALIKLPHLEAALAIIDYYVETCRFIFGQKTGDNTADAIMEHLGNTPAGLTKTNIIHDVFNKNKKVAEIDKALKLLLDKDLVFCVKDTTNNSERWFMTKQSIKEAA